MNILIIIPYEEMKKEVIKLQNQCNKDKIDYLLDINFLHKDLIQRISTYEYDFIIARGGIYTYLKTRITAPLVNLPISYNDILENTLDVSNSIFIGKEGIFSNLSEKVIQTFNLNLLTYNSSNELNEKINYIKKFKNIFTDTTSYKALLLNKVNSTILKSSYTSLFRTYLKGKEIVNQIKKYSLDNHILKKYFSINKDNLFIFKDDQLIIKQIYDTKLALMLNSYLLKNKSDLLINEKYEKFVNIISYTLIINNFFTYYKGNKYNFILIKVKASSLLSFQNNDTYDILESKSIKDKLLNALELNSFIVLLNSDEEILSSTSNFLTRHSKYKNSSNVTIDLNLISKRKASSLFLESSSLLTTRHNFIIKGVEYNIEIGKKLIEFLKESITKKYNNIIFLIKDKKSLKLFKDTNFIKIDLPNFYSLKNKNMILKEEILKRNLLLNKEEYDYINKIHFSSKLDAINFLNRLSLEKIINTKTLSDLTKGYYLNSDNSDNNLDFDTSLTLDELNCLYIKKVLVKNNYNQSKTAKDLKISRSSLYRLLNKYKI